MDLISNILTFLVITKILIVLVIIIVFMIILTKILGIYDKKGEK